MGTTKVMIIDAEKIIHFTCPICKSNKYTSLMFRQGNTKPIAYCCNNCSLIFSDPEKISNFNTYSKNDTINI